MNGIQSTINTDTNNSNTDNINNIYNITNIDNINKKNINNMNNEISSTTNNNNSQRLLSSPPDGESHAHTHAAYRRRTPQARREHSRSASRTRIIRMQPAVVRRRQPAILVVVHETQPGDLLCLTHCARDKPRARTHAYIVHVQAAW